MDMPGSASRWSYVAGLEGGGRQAWFARDSTAEADWFNDGTGRGKPIGKWDKERP